MALMDTIKQHAGVARDKAKQGVSQGQAKAGQLQAKLQAQSLLRNLGAAYYAEQREGGSKEAVDYALAVLDRHVAAQRSTPSSDTESFTENGD